MSKTVLRVSEQGSPKRQGHSSASIAVLLSALVLAMTGWHAEIARVKAHSVNHKTAVSSFSPAQSLNPPILFFTDLTGGPKSGGQENKGAFVTLYGNNFGSSQSGSKVTLGGIPLENCPIWGVPWLWYQKITCQLNSSVPIGPGNLLLNVNGRDSNQLPFAVTSGHIYFVSRKGSDRNNGTYSSPWKTLLRARDKMQPGDITYAMNGVGQEVEDETGWDSAFLLSGGKQGNWCSATGNPRALVTYPGATSVVIGNSHADRPHTGLRTSDCQGNWVFAGISFRGIAPVSIGSGSNYRFVASDITCPNSYQQGACFLTSQVEHIYLYGSHIYDGGTTAASSQFQGVYFSTDSNHVDMGWNLVEHIRGCRGIQIHSSPLGSGGPKDPTGHNQYDLSIHDNMIHDTQCDGMIIDTIDPSQGPVTIYNNILYNVGQGPANPENTGGWNGINVTGNTENGSRGSGTVEVYNNSIYAFGTYARPPYEHENSAITYNGGSAEIRVHILNNLVYSVSTQLSHSGLPYFSVWKPTVGPCGVTENCPWIYGSNNLVFGAGSTVANAANIAGTIIQDPRLMNVGGYDFRPTPDSPVIGKGIHMAGLTHDIAGASRGATPSIGAYE
jgi:hypothetical protein